MLKYIGAGGFHPTSQAAVYDKDYSLGQFRLLAKSVFFILVAFTGIAFSIISTYTVQYCSSTDWTTLQSLGAINFLGAAFGHR